MRPSVVVVLTFLASGILVPMINSAVDAKAIVSYAKFPPVGVRGQGSPFACFELGFDTPAAYVTKANDILLTMIQIETAQGLNNIDEICQVDGIGEPCLSLSQRAGPLIWSRRCINRPKRSGFGAARLRAGEVD